MTKLYTNRVDNQFTFVPLIAAAFSKTQIQLVQLSEEQQAAPEFKAKKGHGQFPILELEDGSFVFESNAIAAYIARQAGNTAFLGETPFQQAKVDQWNLIAATGNWPNNRKVAYNVFGSVWNTEDFNSGVKGIKEQVKILNTHLEGKQWLVGNSITLADISNFISLVTPFALVLDGGFRKAMPHVTAWFQRVSQESAVKSVVGNVKLCEKQVKPVDPAKLPAVIEAPKPASTVAPVQAAKKATEDDFDPFADGGEDDAAAAEALKAKGAEAKDKKAKAAPIAKSIIVWEVKPWGEETDLDVLAAKILGITMDGLSWKTEYKKEPIAYGVFKIVIGAVVEDAKVSTDLVEETILGFEDEVQSIDIQSFNKL